MASDYMEKIYRIGKWIDDPGSEKGIRRYQDTLDEMHQLIEHKWLKVVLTKSTCIKILDVCGGWGIAGVALSKVLKEQGTSSKLTIFEFLQLFISMVWGRRY